MDVEDTETSSTLQQASTSQQEQVGGRCSPGPCKKMKCDDTESSEEEMDDDSEERTRIGQSGLYALARSEQESNMSNNAIVSSSGNRARSSSQSRTEGKMSPYKTYDGDTQQLRVFGHFLDGNFQENNLNHNRNILVPEASTSTYLTSYSHFSSYDNCNQDTNSILPMSLLVNIFQYLSMTDLLSRVCRVCKLWHQAAHDPSLWRHICLPMTSRVTDSILGWLTSLSDRVLSLDVSDGKHTAFTDDGIINILKRCHYLRTLKLARYFVFSDDVFESVGRYCNQIRHLNLDGCFSISDTSIISIGRGCPQLEFLYMSQCNRISDKGMLAIAQGCPRLQQLRIDQCVQVKDVSVKALVAGCPELEYLHLLACSLTDDGLQMLAKLHQLRILDISNMTQLSKSCLENIAKSCKRLEILSVSLNRSVDDICIKTIVQSCIHLKCLSCVACNLTDKSLEYIGQYSKTLERVDVAWCGEITDQGVRAISRSCKTLRYLGLMRCGQVTMETVDDLIPQFPHIHYSNFVLESRKLLQRARNDGHLVAGPHFMSM